ncbi:MAG TPA: hypothetical protein VGL99_24835 [Chloroflexota bacterium]|jgi:hypothetical protein
MSLYQIAVFVHVLGAVGLFGAMVLEWVILARIQHIATAEQAREWVGGYSVIRRLSPAALAALLLAGIYMAIVNWGGATWIVVAFIAFLLLPPLGMISGLRMPGITRDLEHQHGPLQPALRRRLADPLFLASIQVRTAIAVGILFLMTVKPDMTASIAAIGVAIVVGLALSFPALNRARMKTQPA